MKAAATFTRRTLYCILWNVQYIIVQCKSYVVCTLQYNVCRKLLCVLCISVHYCILYTVHCVYCTLYTAHCTLYNVHCTLYSVQCTLYTIHCTLMQYYRIRDPMTIGLSWTTFSYSSSLFFYFSSTTFLEFHSPPARLHFVLSPSNVVTGVNKSMFTISNRRRFEKRFRAGFKHDPRNGITRGTPRDATI